MQGFIDNCLNLFLFYVQVPAWMKETDEDMDGRLSYKEFKQSIFPSSEEKPVEN